MDITVYNVHIPDWDVTWVYRSFELSGLALMWLQARGIICHSDTSNRVPKDKYESLPDETWEFPSE